MTTSDLRQIPTDDRLVTTPGDGGAYMRDRPLIAATPAAEPTGRQPDRAASPELRYGDAARSGWRPASAWLCRIDNIAATACLLTCRRGAIFDLLLRRTQL